MNPVLVVGAESVVGANLAVQWSSRYDVFAASLAGSLDLSGCTVLPETGNELVPETVLTDICPETVVLCGPAARSSWEPSAGRTPRSQSRAAMQAWIDAAQKAGSRIVMISSDAVFTGPWMFHDEELSAHCESNEAQAILELESAVLESSPNALVIRTNALGWSPVGGEGWLETTLARIEARRPIQLDAVRHATPILATDLADLLEKLLKEENVSGIYHIAGAERISPLGFAQRMAGQFNLPWIPARPAAVRLHAATGFGMGECSLQTLKVRRELCVPMPLLSETLERLENQQINGHRERLAPNATVQLRVA